MAEENLTRTQLAERLAAAEARAQAAEAERDVLSSKLQAERAQAEAELQRLRPGAGNALPAPKGQRPPLIPYTGLVQAKVDCVYGCFHQAGEVFHVELPALWSDDPFAAVIQTGRTESGIPVTEPNPLAPQPIDFRFRPKSHEVLADPTPRRANEF